MNTKLKELRFAIDMCEQALPLFKACGWDISDLEDFLADGRSYITETLVGNPIPEPESNTGKQLFEFATHLVRQSAHSGAL